MSIINDMLKDLDTRRGPQAGINDGVLAGLAVSGGTSPVAQRILAASASGCLLVMLAIFLRPYADGMLHGTAADIRQQAPLERAEPRQKTPDYSQVDRPQGTSTRLKTLVSDYDEYQPEPSEFTSTSAHESGHITIETQAGESSTVITKQFSADERVARNHQQALLAVRDGNDTRAERLLDELLLLDSSMHESRLLLAKLQIRQQRNLDAETTLASGLAQYPGYAAYATLYAQLLAGQARFADAARHVETALQTEKRNAGLHALLAGLYQRTGHTMEAARHYQVALQMSPEKGEWWMGLGISLEQNGSRVNAYAAYRRALRYLQSPTLRDYVDKRIRNLSRMWGPG